MKSSEAPKIQMTNATREKVERTSETDETPKKTAAKPGKRARQRRFPVFFWAWSLTVFWLASFAAFGYGAYGDAPAYLLTLEPMVMGAIAAIVFLPLGFIWVGAAAFLRLTDLDETALRLASVSRDLVDPTTTAANDVAKLGATIRKELEGLNREVDGAVSRVTMLEQKLKEQTALIAETSGEVGKRTSKMTAKLADEREKVAAVAKILSDEGQAITEAFDSQALAMDSSAEEAKRALTEAEATLLGRTEALSKASSEAADTTKSIAENIERETGKLESVAANARSRSEAITARFSEQHKLMVETVETQAEQQTRLDAAMDQQQRLITKTSEVVNEQITKMSETVTQQTSRVADRVAQQIEVIEAKAGEHTGKIGEDVGAQVIAVETALGGLNEKLGELAEDHLKSIDSAVTSHTDELASRLAAEAASIETLLGDANTKFADTVEAARARAVEAGEGFTGQAMAMRAAAEAAAMDLDKAVDQVEKVTAQTRESLAEQVSSADSLFGEQAHNARTLLRQHADEMGAALEASINDVQGRLVEFASEGNDALAGRAGELDDALRRSEQRMRALYHRLDESIEGIQLGTDSVSKRFTETADAFEARMAQFPAHAEDAAARVHAHINTQIENLAQIADSAADRAQTLIEAAEAAGQEEESVVPVAAVEEEQADTAPELRAAAPDVPGREVYGAATESFESLGQRRPRIGRPAFGSFDDLARSLAGRLRGGPPEEPAPTTPKPEKKPEPAAEPKKADPDLVLPVPNAPKTQLPKLEERGWKDILAAVDAQEEERAKAVRRGLGSSDDATFERNALLIIEKLQAMSIDIDRALEDTPPTDLLDRYMSGERNVFARRLATFTTPDMLEKIARKHRDDADFRRDVTRYIESFEELLKAARGRTREDILLETYLTSQTGKVYMILGTAVGHLKQAGE